MIYETPARDALDAFPASPFSTLERIAIRARGMSEEQAKRLKQHGIARKCLEADYAAELKDRCYRLQERMANARRIVDACYDVEADLESRRCYSDRTPSARRKIQAKIADLVKE